MPKTKDGDNLVSVSNMAQTTTPESTQNASTDPTTDTIDDAVFEEGDEHTRLITVALRLV